MTSNQQPKTKAKDILILPQSDTRIEEKPELNSDLIDIDQIVEESKEFIDLISDNQNHQ